MTEGEIQKAKDFLASYTLHKQWLNASRYEREYFGAESSGDEVFLQAKLFLVREFIASLPNCPEKLFLNCHYIRLYTVEKSAEMMGISVRNAYRLKKRAIAFAAEYIENFEN
jgi:DNA-directed RNA polymerase specialized sigma24 family protein